MQLSLKLVPTSFGAIRIFPYNVTTLNSDCKDTIKILDLQIFTNFSKQTLPFITIFYLTLDSMVYKLVSNRIVSTPEEAALRHHLTVTLLAILIRYILRNTLVCICHCTTKI